MAFVETDHMFDPRQSGFRSAHSTQSTLLRILNDISIGIDQRKVTILVLLDFSKAFDPVLHLILLTKLRRLCFAPSVLTWLFFYLTDRTQPIRLQTELHL